ncbi:MAG: M20/M25/M40 family metallo-hydrolase [Clostridia bacterium]|nr:M20/M25/M40 family metallo-hydrolase [Clostridia bacterium]
MLTLLKTLCDVNSPSGCEGSLASFIKKEIESCADAVWQDALGNLIVHKKGDGTKLMLCAHMDEIGLVATCHGEKGQVYVSALGGVFPYTALYQRVRFENGAEGVLVPDGQEADLLKDLKLSKLYVDIGAKDAEEAKARVALGEGAAFAGAYCEQGDTVIAKALDNRAGCYALIEALREAKKNKNDIYAVFTVSEELGLRGAKAVAESVKPDYAVALDVTRTGDTASGPKMSVRLGGGAAIKIMDHSMLAHPIIKERLQNLCKERDILWQAEVLERGGTDAGAIHLTGGGVPSGCISIPLRYVHTPGEMLSKQDLEQVVALTKALIEEGI